MPSRRTFIGGAVAAGTGGLPAMRPDQALNASVKSRAGSGPAPSPGVLIAREIIIVGPTGELLVYNPSVALGNLTFSLGNQTGPDSAGNEIPVGGAVSYGPGAAGFRQASALDGGTVQFLYATSAGGAYLNAGTFAIEPTAGTGGPYFLGALLINGLMVRAAGNTADGFIIVNPSGDTTGATDTANINGALVQCPVVILLPGQYYLDATVTLGLGQYVRGSGMSATTVALVSAAGAVPAFKLINATASYSTIQFAGLYDLTVDITNANAGANAVQAGDILQLQLQNVSVKATSSTTVAAVYFVNNQFQTEQAQVRMYITGATLPVQFDVQNTGSNSYDRGSFDFSIDQFNANGNGISWTNGALQIGGSLKVRGNFTGGVTNTGKVLAFSGAGASLQRIQLDISVEGDVSGTGPQTINFGAGSNTIDGYGSVDFLNSGATFQASNNNGQYSVAGEPARGDVTLQTLIGAGSYTFITSGFPAGWSGRVGFQKTTSQDQVFVVFELTIAATTVVTSGETVITGLGSPYEPNLGQFVAVVQTFNSVLSAVPVQITTSGNVLYQGAGFTAAGTSALHGSAVYSNSQ